MEIIRDRYRDKGLSEQVIQLLLASSRENTRAAYQSAWAAWINWCRGINQDPLSNDLSKILSFLSDSFSNGKAYSTLNVIRSMLSVTLDPVEGHPVGQHPLVTTLMRGIFNSRPPQPKYKETWDVDVVLRHLEERHSSDLALSALSRKLATLLALATLCRASDLEAIDFNTISVTNNSLSFSLSKPRKAQKTGGLG